MNNRQTRTECNAIFEKKNEKYIEKTYFVKTTPGNNTEQWLNIVTSKRWDIWSVGPNSIAKVCIFILLVFSFLIIASKCSSNHMSNVRLQLGSWQISEFSSWICAVCDATCPVAASSKRGSRSVVKSGSGSSLREKKYRNKIRINC